MSFKITGTGSYIPENIQKNEDFINTTFLNEDGSEITTPNTETIEKFSSITGILERRYVDKDLNTSDIGYFAAVEAIKD